MLFEVAQSYVDNYRGVTLYDGRNLLLFQNGHTLVALLGWTSKEFKLAYFVDEFAAEM